MRLAHFASSLHDVGKICAAGGKARSQNMSHAARTVQRPDGPADRDACCCRDCRHIVQTCAGAWLEIDSTAFRLHLGRSEGVLLGGQLCAQHAELLALLGRLGSLLRLLRCAAQHAHLGLHTGRCHIGRVVRCRGCSPCSSRVLARQMPKFTFVERRDGQAVEMLPYWLSTA